MITSEESIPEKLSDRLQMVVTYYDDGRRVFHTGARTDHDVWYVFRPEGTVGKAEGVRAEVQAQFPDAVLKQGRWTDDANYDRICEEAKRVRWDGTEVQPRVRARAPLAAGPCEGC